MQIRTNDELPAPLQDINLEGVEQLKQRERVDYKQNYLAPWTNYLLTRGHPTEDGGYAPSWVENALYRANQIHRVLWQQCDKYIGADITHDHANSIVSGLEEDTLVPARGGTYAPESKRKFVDTLMAIFRWKVEERGADPWKPDTKFGKNFDRIQRDTFTREELAALRKAALGYNSLHSYSDVQPDERRRKKAYLAQVLEKPKAEVTPDDWEKVAGSWKIPSLIAISIDAGLRPCEVGRARLDWISFEEGCLIIPHEDAAKNDEKWKPSLRDETLNYLKRWRQQRKTRPKYDDTDRIWLNREGNPFNSGNLNYLLGNLIEEANINPGNRDLVWTSIRASVGTHMVREGNIFDAAEQLRHKSLQSTRRYVDSSLDNRREILMSIS